MRGTVQWSTATVRDVRPVTPTVREFELAPEGGMESWTPGSHIDVALTADSRATTRSYSLVGDCRPDTCRIAVKLAPEGRGGSRYMWSLVPGSRISISSPKNLFELRYGAPGYLLIAGGIGITPIVGMALSLARRKANVRLVYGVRSDDELAFGDLLREALGDGLVSRIDAPIDVAAEIKSLPAGGEVYVCGPIPLLDAVRSAWTAAGREPTALRYETFGNTGRYAPEAFSVTLPRHNLQLTVPADGSLLDTLLAAGVDVLYDCRRGECGLCALDVLGVDGAIDHRDVFLGERERQENRKICACVSRAVRGGITVDSAYRADA